ncbi:MBL fold metallo-hydrolase [Massilia violaceinigra]|uniref:MBL fold metallo-hydrolase n=1 Tax=Massilia violaceinigra TaxID=2045208 RepID=A0ABY4ABA8_9BURK|nr:MBL fold metallo-hydrolase [Massilia violaceinigra]UOD32090.1 MBL fold metallo-hydrolase [Massilia violaceinigra]
MTSLFRTPRTLILAAALGVAAFSASAAHAAAPMAKVSAPGYFRMMLGEFEVTALSDGTTELPVNKLLKTAPAKVDKALAKSFLASPLETSFNAYLINTGSKLVLVDSGAGGLFGPNLGKLVANLKASGYQPEQVDEIYITHLHPDHVGGIAKDGAATFANAVVRADKRDADFWLSQANMEKAPADAKGFFQGAMASLKPYIDAKRFQPFEGDTQLVPGVKSSATYGHTAGHTSYMVESGGKKLLLAGDLIHVGAVQFDEPGVTIAFDSDEKSARTQRLKAFDAAAKDGILVAASHLQFPGIGHVRSAGKSYQWVPVNYTQVR